MVLILITPI